MLSGNYEITRLNSDVTTTMNLVLVSSRVLHVLTYANNPCRFTKLYNNMLKHDWTNKHSIHFLFRLKSLAMNMRSYLVIKTKNRRFAMFWNWKKITRTWERWENVMVYRGSANSGCPGTNTFWIICVTAMRHIFCVFSINILDRILSSQRSIWPLIKRYRRTAVSRVKPCRVASNYVWNKRGVVCFSLTKGQRFTVNFIAVKKKKIQNNFVSKGIQ